MRTITKAQLLATCAVALLLACHTSAAPAVCSISLSSVALNLQGVPTLGVQSVGTGSQPGPIAAASFSCDSEVNIYVSKPILDAVASVGSNIGAVLLPSGKEDGAVLEFEDAELTITNSTFSYLRQVPLNIIFSGSRVQITRSTFVSNAAGSYGALLTVTDGSELFMGDSSLVFNTAGNSSDGIIAVSESSSAELDSLTAQNNVNSAGPGGVLAAAGNSSLAVMRSNFISNAAEMGGAVYADGSSTVSLSRTAFFNNSATAAGGGVALADSQLQTANCSFINNTAAEGGGLYLQDSEATVLQTVFFNNAAGSGAGVYQTGCPAGAIEDSTFAANFATANGGGLYQEACLADITSTLFTSNQAQLGSAIYQVDFQGSLAGLVFNFTDGTPSANALFTLRSAPLDQSQLVFIPESARASAILVSS